VEELKPVENMSETMDVKTKTIFRELPEDLSIEAKWFGDFEVRRREKWMKY